VARPGLKNRLDCNQLQKNLFLILFSFYFFKTVRCIFVSSDFKKHRKKKRPIP
jgi:hypothetical protein